MHRLVRVVNPQLFQDVLAVSIGCIQADVQQIGDFLAQFSLRYQGEYFDFSFGEK